MGKRNIPAQVHTASGTPVRHHVELASTNAEAMRLAVAGERGPLWILADTQSAGRGRSGRDWASPAGNLYASYVFTTPAPLTAAHQLSLVAGVASYDALIAAGLSRERGLRLKWPNDLLMGRAKVGGLLIESTTVPGSPDLAVVVGIGINLATHPVIPGRDTTDLSTQGIAVRPADLLDKLDAAMRDALQLWNASTGFSAIRAAWLARAGAEGEPISVNTGDAVLTGTFAGLDSEGALLLDLEGGERRRCTYGDVTIG